MHTKRGIWSTASLVGVIHGMNKFRFSSHEQVAESSFCSIRAATVIMLVLSRFLVELVYDGKLMKQVVVDCSAWGVCPSPFFASRLTKCFGHNT